MLANALHPEGVHPNQLHATQDQPRVLKRLREAIRATRKEGKRLWDITPSPPPRIDTPSPPRKHRRTDTGGTGTTPTHSTPGAPRATQHDAPDPPAGGAPA